MSVSRKTSLLSSIVAWLCIILYIGALTYGAIQIISSMMGRRALAEQEFDKLAGLATAAASRGFMSQDYQEAIRDEIVDSETLIGAIISGSDGEYGFERSPGTVITWSGNTPQFKRGFGVPQEPYYQFLSIEGQRNVTIRAIYTYIDYDLFLAVLKNTLILVLAGLGTAVFTMMLELALKKRAAARRLSAAAGHAARKPAGAKTKSPPAPEAEPEPPPAPAASFPEFSFSSLTPDPEPPAPSREPAATPAAPPPEPAPVAPPPAAPPPAPPPVAAPAPAPAPSPEPAPVAAAAPAADPSSVAVKSPATVVPPAPPPVAALPPAVSPPPREPAPPVEKTPEKEKITGLYGRSGICWEAHTKDRLEAELHRGAVQEEDLVFAIAAGKAVEGENFTRFAAEAVGFFGMKDLLFERALPGSQGISVIIPNLDLDQGILRFEDFHNRVKEKLPDLFKDRGSLAIGLSSRAGRLIDADRLMFEAFQALTKAARDPSAPIMAFRSDPDRYREFLRRQNPAPAGGGAPPARS